MAGILIIAHAPFASALKECAAHVYAGLPANIGVIDVSPDCDPAKLVEFARSEVDRLREDNGVLVLTDMYGATPANIASRLTSLSDVRVLAGVNLPMLVRVVCYRTAPLDALVEKALKGAANGVHAISAPMSPGEGCAPAPCLAATSCASAPSSATPLTDPSRS